MKGYGSMIDITQIPLFSEIPAGDLASRVAPMLKERHYKKNHVFMFENDQSDEIFILRTGKVKIYRIQDGKEVVLSIQLPGEIFGEAEAISGDNHRICTIEALESLIAWQISKQDFLQIIEEYPSVLHKAYGIMFQRVRVLNRMIRYMTFCDVRAKVANQIMDLYYNFGQEHGTAYKVDMKINHALLGNMVGITRESISKTLSDFQSEGLIDIRQKYIYILNLKKLEQMCERTEEVPALRKW
ncbi:Crp/Fnr family transcriptional regulator [Paenibacillus alvei]|uniref:Crp/Fnr family transcriptional regulator n=4 Tax=Paenibacillus alvei TaxID=44250 RepID=A0ABT4H3V3_PAEAL|nr:Crp/Fnr family transcriptional regulator [Paenibacillus alvei]MCY9539345.1 Crp/Fnr family transcriptional regulator [Paenibacillus alvei]MCY9704769.1 Crp/Fnr family transcriptional regulator [Paenibacillus alvei]MCY9763624.1 Crp/Fnr family transcriptional regulator [Paenibacillus alvei]MCY9770546.1 Crp/Fnr family transcriptional regulator [Paenibacillus alvei]MEC0079852.1 Crp/Fnr family transcriptional regulator [Paenibacillus alvei]